MLAVFIAAVLNRDCLWELERAVSDYDYTVVSIYITCREPNLPMAVYSGGLDAEKKCKRRFHLGLF